MNSGVCRRTGVGWLMAATVVIALTAGAGVAQERFGALTGVVRDDSGAVLPGVTRAAVIEFAKAAGIDVQMRSIDVNQLLEADEVFVTNSAMGVMPVCRIERKAIGRDEPGEVTREVMRRYAESTGGT